MLKKKKFWLNHPFNMEKSLKNLNYNSDFCSFMKPLKMRPQEAFTMHVFEGGNMQMNS